MTEPVSWLLTLSPCSLTLYLFHFFFFFLIWNQNQLETTAEEVWPVRMSAGWTFGKLHIDFYHNATPPPLPSQPQGLLIYFRVESRSLKETRAAGPAIHLETSASCFTVFSFLQAKSFLHILVDQRITSALVNSHGGPVETFALVLGGCLLVFGLHVKHEV